MSTTAGSAATNVTGGIPDEHDARSNRQVDPAIGVGIAMAWSGRTASGEHLPIGQR
jgi:hypothetical protein